MRSQVKTMLKAESWIENSGRCSYGWLPQCREMDPAIGSFGCLNPQKLPTLSVHHTLVPTLALLVTIVTKSYHRRADKGAHEESRPWSRFLRHVVWTKFNVAVYDPGRQRENHLNNNKILLNQFKCWPSYSLTNNAILLCKKRTLLELRN